jgi:osmotically-inducible protein OsmY
MDDLGGGSGIEVWLSRGEDRTAEAALQRRVWDEIRWEPLLEGADLTVEVGDGGEVVTIRGVVHSYLERIAAERAVSRVPGVKAMRSDLCVYLPETMTRTDAEVAQEARRALEMNAIVPAGRLFVAVDSGRVTLEGEVDRDDQRLVAEEAVAVLAGVRALVNRITLRVGGEGPPTTDLPRRVVAAVEHAGVHPRNLTVAVDGDRIVLRGRVRSLADRAAAEHAARSVPGVRALDDQLQIAH